VIESRSIRTSWFDIARSLQRIGGDVLAGAWLPKRSHWAVDGQPLLEGVIASAVIT
jgi:hypothetical protein